MRFSKLIIFVSLLLTVSKVRGQSSQFEDCLMKSEDINDCLIIGGVIINSDRNVFDKTFGKPDDVQIFGDTTTVMYKLPKAFKVRKPMYKYLKKPYILITEVDTRTHSIQLMGYNTKLSLDFYGISLGTETKKVTELFGTAKEVSPWKLLKADIWYFENNTYSFIVQNSRVVGIRLLRN